ARRAGRAHRREDPAAGGVQLLVGRSGGTECELVDAVAGEAGVRVAVDEARDRDQAAAVELVDLAEAGREVAHAARRDDAPLLAQDVRALGHVDLAERAAAERCAAAGGSDELRQVPDEQPAQRQGRPGSSGRARRQLGKRAYACRGSSVSTSTPAPCRCASSETGYLTRSSAREPTIRIAHGPLPAPTTTCSVHFGKCTKSHAFKCRSSPSTRRRHSPERTRKSSC